MITQLKTLFELSAPERNTQIKLRLLHRIHLYSAGMLYASIGYWLNRANSRYILEFRPDSHCDFSKVDDYDTLFKLWVTGNRNPSCGDLARFYALYLNVRQVIADDVPGDFVELGVYKGNSAGILATIARRHRRHVYLFDTFGGFDERDLHGVDGKQSANQFTDTSLAKVQEFVGTEGTTYVKGFFPESASQIEMPEKIAVAHIDCDLYEPMKAGLEWFYPRLSPGGVILLHDYSSGHWPGATRAIDEFFRSVPEKPILLPDKSGSAVVRRRLRRAADHDARRVKACRRRFITSAIRLNFWPRHGRCRRNRSYSGRKEKRAAYCFSPAFTTSPRERGKSRFLCQVLRRAT